MKALNKISFISWFLIFGWLAYMLISNSWYLIPKHYMMSITMAFGSFIAGATSEGGGAVAFPIMTLILKINPFVARDFSLLIQSFGMSAAAAAILKSKIAIEKRVIVLATCGGVIGNFIAFSYIERLFTPSSLKLFFCSVWLAFAFVLVKTKIFTNHDRNKQLNINYRFRLFILFIGIIGGCLSALTGSGLDIVTFSVLTLYYNICEKVATPTSVVIMALNSISAIIIKYLFFDGVSTQAIEYLKVCIPIVVIGAPLGSLFITTRSRNFLTIFLATTITTQFIAALYIIPLSKSLITIALLSLSLSLSLFTLLYIVSPYKKIITSS